MSIIVKLEHKGDTLNLNDHATGGRYAVARDFRPPELTEAVTYGRALDWGETQTSSTERNLSWSFGVKLHGSKATELKRALSTLQSFLNRAGSEVDPLFLIWRNFGDYDYEPKLGTLGKFDRYEIVKGDVLTTGNYYQSDSHGKFVEVTLSLTIKPGALRRMLAGTAYGGVLDDIYGSPNGAVKGLRISGGETNFFKNPVLDHPATWNTGWTAGGDLYEDQNTDPRYYLFGNSSARLVYDGAASGGTADCYLQALTTSALGLASTISCFVKKVDGAAIESSDFFFVRGSTSIIGMGSGSPLPIGDGWYWCWVATTSNGGDYGIRLNTAGRYLYVDGFQFEYGTVPSFLVYGDQPGAAWSGTPHASTSVRTAASVKYPRKILLPSYTEGTVRLVWKPDWNSRYVSSSAVHYLYSDNVIDISYDGTNNRFAASDGTNSVDSTSTILGSGTVYTIHFTFDATNGLALYVNGAQVDTNGTYTLPSVASAGTEIYLGSSTSVTNHAHGTFYGFAVFDREMTSAEVAADYAQFAPLIADDERVDEIPWLWTYNGGGIVYNQNDSGQGNYLLLGGFSGKHVTPEIFATMSHAWSTIGEVHIGRLAIDQRIYSQYIPGTIAGANYNLLFRDLGATVDAACSGGFTLTQSLSTTAVELGGTIAFARQNTYFSGKPVDIIGRIKDSGGGASANLKVTVTYELGGTQEWEDEFKNLPALGTSNYSLVEFGEAKFPPVIRPRPEGGFWDTFYASATVKRSTGTSDLLIDYIAYLPYAIHIAGTSSETLFFLRGGFARGMSSTWVTGQAEVLLGSPLRVTGRDLVLEGNKLNLLNFVIGTLNDSDTAAITWTVTVNECWLVVHNNGA